MKISLAHWKEQSGKLPGWISFLLKVLFLIALFCLLNFAGRYLPIGFDWARQYGPGTYPSFWMPWAKPVINLLTPSELFAVTMLALAVRVYRYHGSLLSLGLAIFSLPVLWVLNLGTVDGIVLAGLLLLPWGAPLVLIKPQVASFALLAHKRSLITAAVWLAVSLLIWGLWPLNLTRLVTPGWRLEWQQDISLFPWGILLALPLLWLSRGDEDLLMAAGSLATPHLFPYHFLVLMPSMARMSVPWMLLTWIITWSPFFAANYFGPLWWHAGNLASLCFWLGIYLNPQRKRTTPQELPVIPWRKLANRISRKPQESLD
jgi:hypothetical protein